MNEQENKNKGVKFDDNKFDWSLLPPYALNEIIQVFMHGAKKYGKNNWKTLDNGIERFYNAMMRHAYLGLSALHDGGGQYDEETRLSHIAQVAANAMILLYLFEKDAKILDEPANEDLHDQFARKIKDGEVVNGCLVYGTIPQEKNDAFDKELSKAFFRCL